MLAKGTFILKIPHLFQKAVSRAVAELLEKRIGSASNKNRDLFLFLLCRATLNVLFHSKVLLFVSSLFNPCKELFEFHAETRNGFEIENYKYFVVIVIFLKASALFFLPEETIL